MHALRRDARDLPQVIERRIVRLDCRRVARSANAGAVRMFGQQTPAAVGQTLPVATVVEIQKPPVVGRGGVTAEFPFVVDLAMAISAALRRGGVGRRIDPLIALAVFGGERLEMAL